jgi:hypothetical protein
MKESRWFDPGLLKRTIAPRFPSKLPRPTTRRASLHDLNDPRGDWQYLCISFKQLTVKLVPASIFPVAGLACVTLLKPAHSPCASAPAGSSSRHHSDVFLSADPYTMHSTRRHHVSCGASSKGVPQLLSSTKPRAWSGHLSY